LRDSPFAQNQECSAEKQRSSVQDELLSVSGM